MALFGRRLAATGVLVLFGVGGCQRVDWTPDPVSAVSEVTGRVWICTPGSVDGTPGYAKSVTSAVRLEVVSGVDPTGRFPPGTVLGQATVRPGEAWPTGTVHSLPVVWLQPGVERSDLESPTARVRVTRLPAAHGATDAGDPWEFSFFVSLDVVTVDDAGRKGIDWHLGVFSTPVVAERSALSVVDATFSELRGWPHPCPPG